jgi:hypothetical protein
VSKWNISKQGHPDFGAGNDKDSHCCQWPRNATSHASKDKIKFEDLRKYKIAQDNIMCHVSWS